MFPSYIPTTEFVVSTICIAIALLLLTVSIFRSLNCKTWIYTPGIAGGIMLLFFIFTDLGTRSSGLVAQTFRFGRLQVELNERAKAANEAEKTFVLDTSMGGGYRKVRLFCPDPTKWAKLSQADKDRWTGYLKKRRYKYAEPDQNVCQ